MNAIEELRRRGFSDAQIAAATVNGKPLAGDLERANRPACWPYKSKAEKLFADRLEARLASGLAAWWAYEPITLVIVDTDGQRCRYTPDFAEWSIAGRLYLYEVKGFLREAARIRFLAARERYPFWTFSMVRRTAGGWETIL